MDSVEADGGSIDEAIAAALKKLGTTRDRVEIEILSNAARGLFGIGGRKARIRATRRKPLDVDALADLGAERHPQTTASPHPAGPPPAAAPLAAPAVTAAAAPRGSGGERARAALQEIVRHLGVSAAVRVSEQDGCTLLELSGDSSGVLIGRRGQMLDALEYVINRIAAPDEGSATRFVVDSENYRTRRNAALEALARRMAEQAKKRGRPVTLNPMSPRDRRVVHLALQGDTQLATRSAGKGYFRKLVIVPGNARGARTRSAAE